jgi:succinoglycan biosynthesis protein ExoH
MDPSLSRKIGLLRFVAVAWVVVYHAYPPGWPGGYFQEVVSLGLARWALPFLGLVSGYLFFRTFTPTLAGYAAKLRTRARTILLPFLLWSGFALLVAWASGSPEFQGPITSPADAVYHWLVRPCASPLWFLQALMTCVVLSPLVWVAVRLLRFWVLALAVAWWVTGVQPDALDPWVSPVAFPPFIVGAAIAMLRPRIAWVTRPAPVWALVALALGWPAASLLFAAYGLDLGPLLRAALLPVVILGALAAWFGYEALRPLARRAPRLVAAAAFAAPLSFFVYASQQPQLKAVMLVLRDHVTGLPQVVDYLLAPLLTMGCSLLVAAAWRRVSPATFSVVSGGRAARGRGPAAAVVADGRTAGTEGHAPAPAGAPAALPESAPGHLSVGLAAGVAPGVRAVAVPEVDSGAATDVSTDSAPRAAPGAGFGSWMP